MDQETELKMADALHDTVGTIEDKVRMAGTSLGKIADEVENIFRTIERLVNLFRVQKDSFMDFKDQATEVASPALESGRKILNKGSSMGHTVADRVEANPIPMTVGTLMVLGGLGLVAYYLAQGPAQTSNADSNSTNINLQ